jgi:hypothetical protein
LQETEEERENERKGKMRRRGEENVMILTTIIQNTGHRWGMASRGRLLEEYIDS